jgi:carbonic anhydrase
MMGIGLWRYITLFCIGCISTTAWSLSLWDYSEKNGPENWYKLSSKFKLCDKGTNQSPINVVGGIDIKLPELLFTYKSSGYEVLNNAHTIQVNMKPGSLLELDEDKYQLIQMHFHTNAEHRLSGRTYPMELHFVHLNDKNEYAIVAVLFNIARAHPFLQEIIEAAPRKIGTNPLVNAINGLDFLPSSKSYYTYSGSLTTPPCTEGVRWIVMTKPITASRKQVKFLRSLMGKNNRPIQPINGRLLTK